MKNENKKLFVSNTQTMRIFNNKFLEGITTTYHYLPFLIFTPIVLYFFYESILFVYDGSIETPSLIMPLFFGALLLWTLIEYTCHRFLFHFNSKTKIGKKLLYIMHGAHHDYPNDLKRVVVPPIVSLGGAAFFYMLAYFILGRYYSAPFIFSLFSFYMIYDWFHYASHHVNVKNKYYNHIKKAHLFHHYKDPKKGYGFITTFWDILLNTNFKDI